MRKREHVRRFKKYCGKAPTVSWPKNCLLSKDHSMGIHFSFPENDIIFFAQLKLKKRPITKHIQVGNMYLSAKLFLLAMKVFRRRVHFGLGIMKFGRGQVFFLKDGNNNILIAPAVPLPDTDTEQITSLIDLIQPSPEILLEWITYSKLFQ